MDSMNPCKRPLGLMLSLLLFASGAQAAASACDEAWAAYNEFKARTVMEPSQYALTVHGAAVRTACGANALPVPPGSDVSPYYPHRRVQPPKRPPSPPSPISPRMP